MSKKEYYPRVVDQELVDRLSGTGAVVIEGPKGCGKTATARELARSEVLLDIDSQSRKAIHINPSLVLSGTTPRLIDEWQTEPAIWNHIRREIDDRRKPGQFILTGSAVPADDIVRHTGAGRLTRLRMRPMSLFELGVSEGEISLSEILRDKLAESIKSEIPLDELVELIARGGWPGQVTNSTRYAIQYVRSYLDEISRVDISRIDQQTRSPAKVAQLIRSLARNVATTATIDQITRDLEGSATLTSRITVNTYLDALDRLMVIENLPAWSPNLRSRARLRSAPKRHFVDPSLAVAAMHVSPAKLTKELEWLGFLFESLVVRDLRIYAQHNDAEVFHFRDNTGLEIDIIVEHVDGNWAAFEVKLGPSRVEDAVSNLKRFAAKFEPSTVGSLSVIISSGYGYRREDGINIIPIGALGP